MSTPTQSSCVETHHGSGPTCGFVPLPRWARGPLSVPQDWGTPSYYDKIRIVIRNYAQGAEQPDPWGPAPSHRTNSPGPAFRSGQVRCHHVSWRRKRSGPKRPGAPDPHGVPDHHILSGPLGREGTDTPPGGSGAATCPQTQIRARLPSFLGKTWPPTGFNAGGVKSALPQQSPRRLSPGCTVDRTLPRRTVKTLAPPTPRASICYAS